MSDKIKAQVRKVLQKAFRLVSGASWIQGELARDAEGVVCPPTDDGACQWCAMGALMAASKGHPREVQRAAHIALRDSVHRAAGGCIGIGDWNDDPDRVEEDVEEVYEDAIALIEDDLQIVSA